MLLGCRIYEYRCTVQRIHIYPYKVSWCKSRIITRLSHYTSIPVLWLRCLQAARQSIDGQHWHTAARCDFYQRAFHWHILTHDSNYMDLLFYFNLNCCVVLAKIFGCVTTTARSRHADNIHHPRLTWNRNIVKKKKKLKKKPIGCGLWMANLLHYTDVTWVSWRLKSPSCR